MNHKGYMFGCCSWTSQDANEGKAVMKLLETGGHPQKDFFVPQQGFECFAVHFASNESVSANIPKLFNIYLRYGAKICGPPAIDRMFKTIDFLC